MGFSFSPGPLPSGNNLAPEIEAYRQAVVAVICEPNQPYSIGESGDLTGHGLEIADRLLMVHPVSLSSFIMSRASGDPEIGLEGIREGLRVLHSLDGNLFVIDGTVSKVLYAYVARRYFGDKASADAMSDYAGVREARKAAYEICTQQGWHAADFVKLAVELHRQRAEDKAAHEAAMAAASAERVRRKSSDDSTRDTIWGDRR